MRKKKPPYLTYAIFLLIIIIITCIVWIGVAGTKAPLFVQYIAGSSMLLLGVIALLWRMVRAFSYLAIFVSYIARSFRR